MVDADSWRFKLLYDGECPFCMVEVRWMTKLNKKHRLAFENIAAPEFDPTVYGATFEEVMGTIHGVFPDGTKTVGVETFRQSYKALGIGWLLAPTGWPILKPIFDWFYVVFARGRVRWGKRFGRNCETGRCAIGK